MVRVHPGPPLSKDEGRGTVFPSALSLEEGDVAQLGERRLCTAEARSSNLLISTARQLWPGSILTSSDAADELTKI